MQSHDLMRIRSSRRCAQCRLGENIIYEGLNALMIIMMIIQIFLPNTRRTIHHFFPHIFETQHSFDLKFCSGDEIDVMGSLLVKISGLLGESTSDLNTYH